VTLVTVGRDPPHTDEGPCAHMRRDTGEAIEVLALPLADAQGFMDDTALPKSAGLLFGLLWLRSHKLGAPAGPPQARLDGA
jgi:hypothetical protein